MYPDLPLVLYFRIVGLMHPVLVITYVLNILDTFNTGFTKYFTRHNKNILIIFLRIFFFINLNFVKTL